MSRKLFELNTERRDRILNAALKEFTAQGYENASTNVIAKEARISKSLMFHYVASKEELFKIVHDFFADLMREEYFDLMDYEEKDIFKRLRQSYLLQMNLVRRYPCILELKKLEKSAQLYENLKTEKKQMDCYQNIFTDIDTSQFRQGLDLEKSKEIILWANMGFTNKILDEMETGQDPFDTESILNILDQYFEELKKLFYR